MALRGISLPGIKPAAGVATDWYTTPVGKFASFATITATHCGTVPDRIYIAIRYDGEVLGDEHHIVNGAILNSRDDPPFEVTAGIQIQNGRILSVKSDNGDIVFNASLLESNE